MRKKVLWVVLVVSLALNAVFASWFTFDIVLNRIIKKDSAVSIAEASKPGFIGPITRIRIKNALRKYIEDGFDDDGLRYISKDIDIEKAYVSPFNEFNCVKAAAQIIGLKEQIRSDEASLQNLRRSAQMQPDNVSTQMQIEMFERRIRENRQAIITNERIILKRDTHRDGKFMGYCVRHRFTIKDDEGDYNDYIERFVLNSNGKRVTLHQSLQYWDSTNFDKTSEVIWGVIADNDK